MGPVVDVVLDDEAIEAADATVAHAGQIGRVAHRQIVGEPRVGGCGPIGG